MESICMPSPSVWTSPCCFLVFIKEGLSSLICLEGHMQKCVSTERRKECDDIGPHPRTFVLHLLTPPRPLLFCTPNREAFLGTLSLPPCCPFSRPLLAPLLGFLSLPSICLHWSCYICIWFCHKGSPVSTQCHVITGLKFKMFLRIQIRIVTAGEPKPGAT